MTTNQHRAEEDTRGCVFVDQTRPPDPVTDVWELLWTAACDYRDANPQCSESRLIDALMPIVRAYGDARVALNRLDNGITS